jgi:hypothetical protein
MPISNELRAGIEKLLLTMLARSEKGEQISDVEWSRLAQFDLAGHLIAASDERAKRSRGLILLAIGLIAIAAVLFGLSVTKIWWPNEIDVSVASTYLSFVLEARQQLTEEPILVSRLVVRQGRSGAQIYQLPPKNPGKISINMLEAPSGATVSIQPLDGGMRIGLSSPAQIDMAVTLEGSVKGQQSKRIETKHFSGADLDFDLEPISKAALPFVSQLNTSGLELFSRNTRNEEVSGIISGSLYLEPLGGKKYELRIGSLLRLDKIEGGEVLGLTLTPATMKLRFHGKASKVRLGSAAETPNLTPSLLEWIGANHRLTLFWTAASVTGGLLLAGLKLMGILDKS